jgi:hypothetical protein
MLAVLEQDHNFDRASRAAPENPEFGERGATPARWSVRDPSSRYSRSLAGLSRRRLEALSALYFMGGIMG